MGRVCEETAPAGIDLHPSEVCEIESPTILALVAHANLWSVFIPLSLLVLVGGRVRRSYSHPSPG